MSSAQQNVPRARRASAATAAATATPAPDRYQIELIDKVVRLLEALRDSPRGLTLQALAARTGYVKSSIHRAMQSLKRHGYVEQPTPGGAYRLGVQFLILARGLQDGIDLLTYARPSLQELMLAFDESVYLAILRDGRGIFVDVAEPRRQDLRLVGPLGAAVLFHATAAGKAIAANLPEAARAALLARVMKADAITARTRTRRPDIVRDWAEVVRRGYAINNEETILGALFAAAPVFDAERAVCGSISVGIPKPRYTAAIGRSLVADLRRVCARLSETLAAAGYVHEDRQLHDLR